MANNDNTANTNNTDNKKKGAARVEATLSFDGQGRLSTGTVRDALEAKEQLQDLTEDITARKRVNTETPAQVADDLARLAEIGEAVGRYVIAPPLAVLEDAATYYLRYVETIQQALRNGGATEETIQAVTEDYKHALFGVTPLIATAEQMKNATDAVKPFAAFSIDRPVFFFAVLRSYNLILYTLDGYNTHVKQQPDAEKRQQYFDGLFDGLRAVDAVAFDWLRQNGVFTVSDFAGMEQATIGRILGNIDAAAEVGEYCTYYCVSKLALNATEEQLRQINPPYCLRVGGPEYAYNLGERVAEDWLGRFNDISNFMAQAAQLVATGQTPTPETVQRARDIVRVSETMALILSRDVYTAEGPKANKILPISRYIEAYLRKRGTDLVYITTNAGEKGVEVTPRMVEKAIEGVNLLQLLYKVQPNNGVYRFETNLTEFSELCGFTDANDEQKLQLLASLMILNGLYLVVWRSSGQHAVSVLHIPEFGISGEAKGRVIIDVTTEAMKGRPQLVTMYDFQRLRKLAKGAAKNHFRYQILAKGQREERALVSEVFGYQYKLDELKDKPDELARARDDIRKHGSRDKKALQKWFDEYAQLGVIKYTRTKNPNGQYVYKWRRVTEPTEQERAELEQNKFDNLLLEESGTTEADTEA